MKTVQKTLSLGILTLILLSCEPFYGSDIKNDSSRPILIILEFDRKTLEDAWDGRSYIPFLKTYAVESGISIVKFDSINLITNYEVSPGVSFSVEHGQGVKPDYDLYKSIMIVSDDTLSLDNRTDIEAAFEHVEKWRWKLTVK